jgi:hypothetical protein
MSAKFESWYNQLSLTYDKRVKAASSYWRWSDEEKVVAKDKDVLNARALASAFTMWVAVLVDVEFSPKFVAEWVGDVTDTYCQKLEVLFKDLKRMVTLVRNCAGWDTIYSSDVNSVLLRPLFSKTDWRTSATSFKAVHTAYNFMSRVYSDREVLKTASLTGFTSRCTGNVPDYSQEAKCTLSAMSAYIGQWLSDWRVEDIAKGLSFSSGNTCDCKRDLAAKVASLDYIPSAIRDAIRYSDCPALSFYLPEEDFEDVDWKDCSSRYHRRNKVCAVPKSATAYRIIAMETAVQNFFQKGVDYSIRVCDSFPKWAIRFEDQSYAQMRALQGSRDGSLATIDFSAASDSITFLMMQILFERTPLLAFWLAAVRSPEAEIKFPREQPSLEELVVYASMGNVNCFSVLSLTVYALACYACDLAGCSKKEISVYGDDLVIPVDALSILFQLAAELGFVINKDKSFGSGPFREACGIFAFDGVDVTTPMYPRQYVDFFSAPSIKSNKENRHRAKPRIDYRWATAVNSLGNEFYLADMPLSRYICFRRLVDAGVTFVTGNPRVWTPDFAYPIRKEKFEKEWLYLPQAPLYAYSPCERVSVVRTSGTSDQYDQVVKRTYTHSCPIVQFAQRRGLPIPHRVKPRALTECQGKGFIGLTYGEPAVLREYDGEERLRIWLYQAKCSERQRLFEAPGFPDLREPLRVPLAVYSGSMLCVTKDALLFP